MALMEDTLSFRKGKGFELSLKEEQTLENEIRENIPNRGNNLVKGRKKTMNRLSSLSTVDQLRWV